MIYISACLLLDPFQQYLEMPVIFGLSICTASAKISSVGNVGEGGNSYKKFGLQVVAEMKISS